MAITASWSETPEFASTRVSHDADRISSSATSEPPGRRTSTRATSGWVTAARSPASAALAATPTNSNSPSESSAAAVPAAIKSWSSATRTRTGTPAMSTGSPRVRRKSIPNRAHGHEIATFVQVFCALAGGFGLNVEPDVVEFRAAALADRLHVGRPERLRKLLQVVAEADRAQVAAWVGRCDRIGLEPGLDLREAGAGEPLGRLVRAGEVPGALPAVEVVGVGLLGADRLRGLVEALHVPLSP